MSDMAGFTGLDRAEAIADTGYIVGWGDVGESTHAFIAVPISPQAAASASSQSDRLFAAAFEAAYADDGDDDADTLVDEKLLDMIAFDQAR